jgi:hypothetical protein
MKKLIISLLSVAFVTTTVLAQETGIKGGLNLSSLSTEGNNDKNLKAGLHAGVFTKIPLSESFSLQPELLYSGKGIKLNYDESAFADGETKFNLNYIDLPVKLVFNLSEDFEFQFGPYVGYLVNANVDTNAEILDFWEFDSSDELDREHFRSLDVGLVAGLGFDLNPLIVGFNYNLGLNQVAKSDDIAYDILGDARNSVIQVYVGMKF